MHGGELTRVDDHENNHEDDDEDDNEDDDDDEDDDEDRWKEEDGCISKSW